jgi:hypothetical protein
MARKISFKQAVNEAIAQEMSRDERVIVMGEDNVGGMGGDGERDAWGGALGVTKGLYGKFGDRVMDTPISESAFIGAPRPAVCALWLNSCLSISWESASIKSSTRRQNFVTCLAAKR